MKFIKKTAWYRKFEDKLFDEAVVIEQEVLKIRSKRLKPLSKYEEYKDFPAMIIAAKYRSYEAIGRSRDGRTGNHRKKLHPLLVNALIRAGWKLLNKRITLFECEKVGNKVYFFGSCAEDDASDKIINHYRGIFGNLNKIRFTEAHRPRTWELKEYCDVCQEIFS